MGLKNHTDCEVDLVLPKFSRYSSLMTVWSVKTFVVSDAHFEKMLYDNAQLARVSTHVWQVSHNPLFRRIAEETLDYVEREMTAPEGGFYAAQDADTEGEEGRYYTWSAEGIRQVFGGPATQFLELHGVSEEGEFEGRSILTFRGPWEAREAIKGAQQVLLAAREQRVRPHRDEKILTSWNGLMVAAFADAGRALEAPRYTEIAARAADFLLRELRDSEGRLFHSWRNGRTGPGGFLEDYSHLIEGLLALYQSDFAPRWYLAAQELAEAMLAHFGAEVGFYDTADDAETLFVRSKEVQDNALPSGNAMATTVLLRLARFSGESRYEEAALRNLAAVADLLREQPLAFGQWLLALDEAIATPVEVAVIGDATAPETRALVRIAQEGYQPHRQVAAGRGDTPPLLSHREQIDSRATAYVCRGHVCQAPVVEAEALKRILQ